MAARIRKTSLTDSWKAKISASMLMNRLNKHALDAVDMSPTQIQAAKIVLDKMISNAPAETTTHLDGNVEHKVEVRIVDPASPS